VNRRGAAASQSTLTARNWSRVQIAGEPGANLEAI
jgi:hypothetical protein